MRRTRYTGSHGHREQRLFTPKPAIRTPRSSHQRTPPPSDQHKGYLHLNNSGNQRTVHNSSITRSPIAHLSSTAAIAVQPQPSRAAPTDGHQGVFPPASTGSCHTSNPAIHTVHRYVPNRWTGSCVPISAPSPGHCLPIVSIWCATDG